MQPWTCSIYCYVSESAKQGRPHCVKVKIKTKLSIYCFFKGSDPPATHGTWKIHIPIIPCKAQTAGAQTDGQKVTLLREPPQINGRR